VPIRRNLITPYSEIVECTEMKFAMVKISRSRNRNQSCAYSSMIMQIGASPKWTNNFASEDEMLAVVIRLLAKQNRPDDLHRVLHQSTNGGYYFFDLDLTAEEAESLGYRPIDAPILYSSQGHLTFDSSRFEQRHA
jgi:hypothetical protein